MYYKKKPSKKPNNKQTDCKNNSSAEMIECDFMLMHLILKYGFPCPQLAYKFVKLKKNHSLHKTIMKTLAIICVLAFVYVYSEACSCVFQHPQVHFCNADFGRYTIIFFYFRVICLVANYM